MAAKLAQYCAAGMPDFANRFLLKIRNGVAPTTCRGFDELCLDGDRLAGAVLARSFPSPGPAAPFFDRARPPRDSRARGRSAAEGRAARRRV